MYERLGPYDLEAAIGRGATGRVYRAVHRHSGERVALKVLAAERAGTADGRERFRREVRAVAGLEHPNVVGVHDYGTDPAPWLAMDLASSAVRLVPPVDWRGLRSLLEQALRGLAHVHARGILHRDLKPANLLWRRPGVLLLSDFGMAGFDEGVRGGTPAYSPRAGGGAGSGSGPGDRPVRVGLHSVDPRVWSHGVHRRGGRGAARPPVSRTCELRADL